MVAYRWIWLEKKPIGGIEEMEVQHRGWDWSIANSDSWDEISGEFLPVAIRWANEYHSIIDIGAGKGRHSFFFAERGFQVKAIDLSENGVEYIRAKSQEKGLTVDAVVADMTNLPFSDESFDCSIYFHTIYHTNYAGVKKTLNEIHRVLKDNGEAFVTFNTKDNPNYNADLSSDGYTIILTEGHECGMPHCYLNEKELVSLLKESNFKIISMNKTTNYVRNGKKSLGVHFFVHIKKTNA